jgi:hypothetical protein
MELGTGVFLSAVFLGTVALFIVTKDRWNWKKVFLLPVVTILGLSVIGGTAVYFYNQYQSRPVLQTTLWGIALGASPAEVKFLRGEPSERISEDTWQFLLDRIIDQGSYFVRFKDGKVRFIVYHGPQLHAPTIAGISPYSSLQEIENKLGAPSFVSRSNDELRRWYSFDNFNVAALFEKGGVAAIGIYDAQTGPIRFQEEAF